MAVATLEYEPRREFDTGRFVALYLQVLAWLSIGWMIVTPIFFDSLSLDPSFIFYFWAARALKRHSPIARAWVLGLGGLGLAICLIFLAIAIFHGTGGMTISLGRPIHHPAMWQVLVAFSVASTVIGIPFFVLLSKPARHQFAGIPARRDLS
jgi:hypothetical protein